MIKASEQMIGNAELINIAIEDVADIESVTIKVDRLPENLKKQFMLTLYHLTIGATQEYIQEAIK